VPTTILPLSLIQTDAGTQSRAALDEIAVGEYAESMLGGNRFPPVVVFHHTGDYCLADGFHRLRARQLAKFRRIEAEIRHGDWVDALKCSLAANRQHGLRRTSNDKRLAVETALRELPPGATGPSRNCVEGRTHRLLPYAANWYIFPVARSDWDGTENSGECRVSERRSPRSNTARPQCCCPSNPT